MKVKGLICVFCVFFLFQACGRKSAADFNSDFSLFKEYIVSFTGGIVSAQSDIRVVLAFEENNWKVNQVLDQDLFDISPSVDGKVIALSNNTIAFIPEKKLESGTEYQVTLHLDKLHPKVAEKNKELSNFNFTVKTIKQDFIVNTLDVQSYSKDYQYLNCVLKTADNIDLETAKKIVEAEHNGENLQLVFEKSTTVGKEFKFRIDSIQRLDSKSNLEIAYDGSDFDIDQKGTIDFPITALNEFKVVKTEIQEGDDQSLSINFSEPLEKGQDFKGLVAIQNTNNLKFSTQGNVLKIYFDKERVVEKPVEVVSEPVSEGIVTDSTVVVSDTTVVEESQEIVEVVATETVDASQKLTGELLLEVFQG
ncbi:MAG: hypothetical protein ACOVKP_09860, partial [Flavobacterium sp.]